MEDEAKTTPTWGYHKTKEPKIFDLKDGEGLPRGWRDAPHPEDEPAEESEPEAVTVDVQDAG